MSKKWGGHKFQAESVVGCMREGYPLFLHFAYQTGAFQNFGLKALIIFDTTITT